MNARRIAINSFWNGLEFSVTLIVTLGTSILIARLIGPLRLGSFVYIAWLSSIAAQMGNLGIPAMAGKYMSEHVGAGNLAGARAVFEISLKAQALLALAIAVVGSLSGWLFFGANERLLVLLLYASIIPMMLNSIVSQANFASENGRANTIGSLVSSFIYVVAVLLSLFYKWDLIGIAAGLIVMRTAELSVRSYPVFKRFATVPRCTISYDQRVRMLRFSGQSIALMAIYVFVWDRSEFLFLKWFSADVRQIAYYSTAFNLTEKLLMVPGIIGSSIGVTIFAQYGRDPTQLRPMVQTALRYLAIIAFPLCLCVAVLSPCIVLVCYGSAYQAAIPVLRVGATLCVFKALLGPINALLASAERQMQMLRYGLIATAINLFLDFVLIPHFASVGAALANGLAQSAGVISLYLVARRQFSLVIPVGSFAKIGLSSGVTACGAWILMLLLPAVAAVLCSVVSLPILYFAMLRMLRVFTNHDVRRIQSVAAPLPAPFVMVCGRLSSFLLPAPLRS